MVEFIVVLTREIRGCSDDRHPTVELTMVRRYDYDRKTGQKQYFRAQHVIVNTHTHTQDLPASCSHSRSKDEASVRDLSSLLLVSLAASTGTEIRKRNVVTMTATYLLLL